MSFCKKQTLLKWHWKLSSFFNTSIKISSSPQFKMLVQGIRRERTVRQFRKDQFFKPTLRYIGVKWVQTGGQPLCLPGKHGSLPIVTVEFQQSTQQCQGPDRLSAHLSGLTIKPQTFLIQLKHSPAQQIFPPPFTLRRAVGLIMAWLDRQQVAELLGGKLT